MKWSQSDTMTKSQNFSPGQLLRCPNDERNYFGIEIELTNHSNHSKIGKSIYYINPGEILLVVEKFKPQDDQDDFVVVLVNEKTVCIHADFLELISS